MRADGGRNPAADLLVQPQEGSGAGRVRARRTHLPARPRRRARDHARQRNPAQGRAQPGECAGHRVHRRHRALRARADSQCGQGIQGRRAPVGICRDGERRRVLQRFQGNERGCDHQGVGVIPRQHPHHPRRQGQGRALHAAGSSAARTSQARLYHWRRGRENRRRNQRFGGCREGRNDRHRGAQGRGIGAARRRGGIGARLRQLRPVRQL